MKACRTVAFAFLSVVLAGFVSGTAAAAPFAGTLGLSISPWGAAAFPGAGSGGSTASQLTLPGGTFTGMAVIPVGGHPPITAFQVTISGNSAGAFVGNPLAGTMPVSGAVVVKGFIGSPFVLVTIPLFTGHDPGSAAGANGLGVGGSLMSDFGAGVYLQAFHTGWTEGVKTVTGLVSYYVYHVAAGSIASASFSYPYLNGTAMYTGTDSRTPGGLGQVTLVSPTKVVTNVTGGLEVFVLAGTLTLSFVPEPSTLLLLGSGVAGLAMLGRRRIRG